MKQKLIAALSMTSLALLPLAASAHIGVPSGPAFADQTQEVSFGVGHGCGKLDTYRVRIDIPAGISSVRVINGDFGRASVVRDPATMLVTAVEWVKPVEQLRDADDAYYKLTLRIKVPNKPFTTMLFPTHQTCRGLDGTEVTDDWVAENEVEGGPKPAPIVKILPARRPGWNKYTVPAAIEDLNSYFGDAAIVWKGTSAFSPNTITAEQISGTAGVEPLTSLAAGDEIWVKY